MNILKTLPCFCLHVHSSLLESEHLSKIVLSIMLFGSDINDLRALDKKEYLMITRDNFC